MVSISFGVTAPSGLAIPSQVADRTKRFASFMPLISLLSNNLLMLFPFFDSYIRTNPDEYSRLDLLF